MSYGIEILNSNDRILVDENYPNIGFVSTTPTTINLSASGRVAYPGISGVTSSDLIFARTGVNDSGYISAGWDQNSGFTQAWWEYIDGPQNSTNAEPQQFYHPSSMSVYVLRDMSGIYSPSTSGYGMEVYKSNGSVIFTSNITKYFTIVTVGSLNSNTSGVRYIDFPSTTGTYSDLAKYYCLITPSFSAEIPVFTQLSAALRGYQYIWTSSTAGRIRVWSTGFFWSNYLNNVNPPTLNYTDVDFNYMIIKEIG